MDNAVSIHGTELAALARRRYPFSYSRALDKDYNIPTEDAFAVFNKELSKAMFDLYGDKWFEFRDCDSITFTALELAFRKHFLARYAGKGNAQGIAIGLLCFNVIPVDFLSGHCLGVRLLPDKKTLLEFEPQNRLANPLTPEQCATASLCLFF